MAMPGFAEGRLAALAAAGARDLAACARGYGGHFAGNGYDGAFFALLAQANVICAPGLDRWALETLNRVGLWTFGIDRLIDTEARSRGAADAVARRCVDVA